MYYYLDQHRVSLESLSELQFLLFHIFVSLEKWKVSTIRLIEKVSSNKAVVSLYHQHMHSKGSSDQRLSVLQPQILSLYKLIRSLALK